MDIRVLKIKNISGGAINFNGETLGSGDDITPDREWWLSDDYTNYLSTNLTSLILTDDTEVSFNDGTIYNKWLSQTKNYFIDNSMVIDDIPRFVLAGGTAGQIQYHSSTDGKLAGANFYWDDVNKRLGIGTETPDTKFDIEGNANGETQITLKQFNNGADAPDIRFYKSRGNSNNKTSVQNGDYLAYFNSIGRDSNNWRFSGGFGWIATDNKANSRFTLSTRAYDQIQNRLEVTSTGNIRLNNAYTLPNNAPSFNNVLISDSIGNLLWTNSSSLYDISDGLELNGNDISIKINPNSLGILEASNQGLSVTKLVTTETFIDNEYISGSTSFIMSEVNNRLDNIWSITQSNGTYSMSSGDFILFNNIYDTQLGVTGSALYIRREVNNIDNSDFNEVQTPDLSDSYIRSLFTYDYPLQYNPSSGHINLDSNIAGEGIVWDNGILSVDSDSVMITATIGSHSSNSSIQSTLNYIYNNSLLDLQSVLENGSIADIGSDIVSINSETIKLQNPNIPNAVSTSGNITLNYQGIDLWSKTGTGSAINIGFDTTTALSVKSSSENYISLIDNTNNAFTTKEWVNNRLSSSGVSWGFGNTNNRPLTPENGQLYFDTDLGYPIIYNGMEWVNMTGGTYGII
jgi:hypothetical protein